MNDLTEDDEQKFCCGDMTNRFCCSFAEKLREIPGFDPSEHYDASVRYRLAHSGHLHFWHYLLGFTLSVLGIGFITYVFGSIIFEVSKQEKIFLNKKHFIPIVSFMF